MLSSKYKKFMLSRIYMIVVKEIEEEKLLYLKNSFQKTRLVNWDCSVIYKIYSYTLHRFRKTKNNLMHILLRSLHWKRLWSPE